LKNSVQFKIIIKKYEENEREFFKFEIDAELHLETVESPVRRFENKLYTCPGQSHEVLIKYLYPEELKKFFTIRDYLGTITFANIHDAKDYNRPYVFPKGFPDEKRYEWLLHFVVIDKRILLSNKRASEHASEILKEIKADHEFFMKELELNRDDCSISLIENYVKVVNLLYMIEDLKMQLEDERRQKDEINRQKDEINRQRESERRQKEENEKKVKILLQTLKEAGIKPPFEEEEK
jgi:hypothetical protein